MKPAEIRQISFRTAQQVIRAHTDNQRFELQNTAFLAAHIYNFGAIVPEKTVNPDDVLPEAFGKKAGVDHEWLEQMHRRHEERVERELSQEESNGDNPE